MMMMLQVREMVVQGYALDAIFRHENMSLTDEDINETCRMMAPNANPAQVREQIVNEGKEFVLRESAERLSLIHIFPVSKFRFQAPPRIPQKL